MTRYLFASIRLTLSHSELKRIPADLYVSAEHAMMHILIADIYP